MLIWIPVSLVALALVGFIISIRRTAEIPVFINGLIPSLPGAESKEESGTTVYIVYIHNDGTKEETEIFRGYADDNGWVDAAIPAENAGRRVLIRWRHAAYKFDEFETTIPRYGIIHTVKMEIDRVYSGKIRGKEVPDLKKHYEDAIAYADLQREKYIRASARTIGHPFARIRVEFWLASYLLLIFTFALDYWRNFIAFKQPLTTFTHALYFSVVTITTLGYGDSHPTTDLLRIACSIEAVIGVLILGFALNSLYRGPEK